MGTFHQGRDALHGHTLCVETSEATFVGRCDDLRDGRLLLVDVAACRGDAAARAAFRQSARTRGVWVEQARLALPLSAVTAWGRLGGPEPDAGAPLDTPGSA